MRLVRQEYVTRHDHPFDDPWRSVFTIKQSEPVATPTLALIVSPRSAEPRALEPRGDPDRRSHRSAFRAAGCLRTFGVPHRAVPRLPRSPHPLGADPGSMAPAVPENNIADGLNSRISSVATMAALTFPTPERPTTTCRPFRMPTRNTYPRTATSRLSWRRRSIGATSPVMPRTPTMDCASAAVGEIRSRTASVIVRTPE